MNLPAGALRSRPAHHVPAAEHPEHGDSVAFGRQVVARRARTDEFWQGPGVHAERRGRAALAVLPHDRDRPSVRTNTVDVSGVSVRPVRSAIGFVGAAGTLTVSLALTLASQATAAPPHGPHRAGRSPHRDRLYQFWTCYQGDNGQQRVRSSDDHGRTWSDAAVITPGAVDTQNSQALTHPDGLFHRRLPRLHRAPAAHPTGNAGTPRCTPPHHRPSPAFRCGRAPPTTAAGPGRRR